MKQRLFEFILYWQLLQNPRLLAIYERNPLETTKQVQKNTSRLCALKWKSNWKHFNFFNTKIDIECRKLKFEGKETNTDWFASSASALSYLVLCVKMWLVKSVANRLQICKQLDYIIKARLGQEWKIRVKNSVM